MAISLVCPSCRKTAAPESSGEVGCSRCGADLKDLAAVARAAAVRLQIAGKALEAGCPSEALRLATDSWKLRRTKAAARFACIAASTAGDKTAALGWLGCCS